MVVRAPGVGALEVELEVPEVPRVARIRSVELDLGVGAKPMLMWSFWLNVTGFGSGPLCGTMNSSEVPGLMPGSTSEVTPSEPLKNVASS